MIKRFLNALGLATQTELNAVQKTIEEILKFQENQKTFLEHKFKEIEDSHRVAEIEEKVDCLVDSSESIESRLDVLEEEGDEVLTKSNFDIDNHFDIDNYQEEIDVMINNEIDYSHSFVDRDDIEEMIMESLKEFKTDNYEDPDVSMEELVTRVIEQIGGAILGLNHTEPEPPKPSTEYIDPVLKEIISDPLLSLLDED